MISTVKCSENGCAYQSDGVCMLGSINAPIKNITDNRQCIYFCDRDSVNSASQERLQQT